MAKYRRRAGEVEAVQWAPDSDWAHYPGGGYQNRKVGYGPHGVEYLVTECGVRTAGGFMRLSPGDWIIVGDDGRRWVVEAADFPALYEGA